MFGVNEKLEELKQLYKSGLIDKDEYLDLKARSLKEFGMIPESLQNLNTTKSTQTAQPVRRTQPQRTYTTQRTQPQRTQTTQRNKSAQPQKRKGKGCLFPYAIFIIASIVIGLLQDCN